MKKLLVFALFSSLASVVQAGRIDDILIMTEESIQATLGLYSPERAYEISEQDFTKAAPGMDLAIRSNVTVFSRTNNTEQWTCVTQFVKTPKFFGVSKTECK